MFTKIFCCFNGNDRESFYKRQKIIGAGSFGTVVSAYDEHNQKIAIKHSHPNVYSMTMLMNEYRILRMLDHPNIIKPVKLDTEEITSSILPYFNATMSMVMPYYKTDVLDYVNDNGHLEEQDVKMFIKAIANALKHAHDKNIVHLDIKPENILMNHDISKCVLADWGGSKFENKIKQSTLSGTEMYAAPELFSNWELKTKNKIGKPVDVYSLGATAYNLMTSLPITDRTGDNKYIPTQADNDKIIKKLHCSSMLKNLLIGMLQVDPEKRMTVDDVLKHPFLNSHR
ncbi:serine-threonine kinase [Only Syngen Nebraska virus 5]|uniref:serine-threonine kinase n=1 Tax=Only Syngen Nebraska virus 5 TaxID=1917232 RepID=UPI000901738F|nr:serine-threonine kinase [Only Syngen Nebraska virus 5]APC25650.1 Ser/Thr protein kinase [Only Syngen Nebraska virus 5]